MIQESNSEPFLRIEMQDGSTKEIKLSELSSITFSCIYPCYLYGIFKVWSKTNGLKKYNKIHNDIKFDSIYSRDPIMIIGGNDKYYLSDIEKISLKNTNDNLLNGIEYKKAEITFSGIKWFFLRDKYKWVHRGENFRKIDTITIIDTLKYQFQDFIQDDLFFCPQIDCNDGFPEASIHFCYRTEWNTNGYRSWSATCKYGKIRVYLNKEKKQIDSIIGIMNVIDKSKISYGADYSEERDNFSFRITEPIEYKVSNESVIYAEYPVYGFEENIELVRDFAETSEYATSQYTLNHSLIRFEANKNSYIYIRIFK